MKNTSILHRHFINHCLRSCGAASMLAFIFSTPAFAQAISETRFNDTTGIELKGGAILGAGGTGVSGQASDKAYSADTSSAHKASATLTDNIPAISGCEEMTVTAWYKPRADQTGPVELFNAFGTLLIWETEKHEWTWRVDTKPTDPATRMYWFFSGKPPLKSWMTPGKWTFIAMVWKRSDGSGAIYQGDNSTPLALSRTMQRKDQVEALAETGNLKRMIGNDPAKQERAFNGDIDNVRFFAKALSQDDLEKIRAADAANQAVSLP